MCVIMWKNIIKADIYWLSAVMYFNIHHCVSTSSNISQRCECHKYDFCFYTEYTDFLKQNQIFDYSGK